MMYALFAENTETRERKFMGGIWLSLDEAGRYIQQLVDLYVWPDNSIPVAVDLKDDMNTYAFFIDFNGWEHCGRMVHETN